MRFFLFIYSLFICCINCSLITKNNTSVNINDTLNTIKPDTIWFTPEIIKKSEIILTDKLNLVYEKNDFENFDDAYVFYMSEGIDLLQSNIKIQSVEFPYGLQLFNNFAKSIVVKHLDSSNSNEIYGNEYFEFVLSDNLIQDKFKRYSNINGQLINDCWYSCLVDYMKNDSFFLCANKVQNKLYVLRSNSIITSKLITLPLFFNLLSSNTEIEYEFIKDDFIIKNRVTGEGYLLSSSNEVKHFRTLKDWVYFSYNFNLEVIRKESEVANTYIISKGVNRYSFQIPRYDFPNYESYFYNYYSEKFYVGIFDLSKFKFLLLECNLKE